MQKTAQNYSLKDELEEALYDALEGAPKISLSQALKIAKKCKEKDVFDVAVDILLDGAIKGAPESTLESVPKVALSNLHKDVQKGAFEVAPKSHFKKH